MCCLNALPRRNFPFFVRLKRFAAPRWVFSLIFFAFFAILFLCTPSSALRPESAVCSARSAISAVALLGCRRCRAGGRLRLAAAALRTPRQDGVHLIAFHPRHRFSDGHIRQFL